MFLVPEVCVLPVAGLSTRNLPATKVIHKGFLTLHGVPIIQYAVDACREIGVKEIVFVYSDEVGKELFERYFASNEILEHYLKEHGKNDLLKVLHDIVPENMKFSFVKQDAPKGNGHAILMAKDIIGKRDFIVMWPDDVYLSLHGMPNVLAQLAQVYQQTGGVVENIMECRREDMVRYGALVGAVQDGRIVKAQGLIEKPALENVPSNFASMGPYLLPNVLLDILTEVRTGVGGEVNLSDAIDLAAKRGIPLHGVLCDAVRFDCGTKYELEKSNIRYSLMQDESLRVYTRQLLDSMVL